MSVMLTTQRPLQLFFRSAPALCPYLPGQVESKLFTRLAGPDASDLNSKLTRAGFRRSHDIVYRPVCARCSACVPVRVPVDRFEAQRSLRRTLLANADLELSESPPVATVQRYRLFMTYQRMRHADSEMARMSMVDFAAMLEEGRTSTSLFELRDGAGTILGAILTDRLDDGFSAIYSFYDPLQAGRGLGSMLILSLITRAQLERLPFVYLGYWIAGSPKMQYKARFRPLEMLTTDGWGPFEVPRHMSGAATQPPPGGRHSGQPHSGEPQSGQPLPA